jgi:branched-chain amino acid transport system permease protein
VPSGEKVPDPFRWAGGLRYEVSALFILGIAFLVLLYLESSVRTPLGRMLRGIRDNEDVAESLGKDVTRIRMKTLIIASAIAAIGGALYAFNTGNMVARAYTRATWTFWPWLIVIIGGAANNMGVTLGTFAYVAFRRFILFYKEQLAFVPFEVIWLDFLLLGIVLILIQIYRPGGIIPEKPTSTLSRKKLEEMVSSRKAVSSSKRKDSKGEG